MAASTPCANLAHITEGWPGIHAESVALISKIRSAAGKQGDDVVVVVDEARWKLGGLLAECEALIVPPVACTCEAVYTSSESVGE